MAVQEIGLGRGGDRTFARGSHRCRFRQQGLGPADCRRLQFAFQNLVNQARLQGFFGTDRRAAADHLQRQLGADQPRQALGAAGTGQEAQLDFRQPQPGAGEGCAVVAGHRQLEAATQSGAVQSHRHRFGKVFQGGDDIGQAGRLGRLAELGNVGAGNKGPACAENQQQLAVVGAGLLQ